MAGYFLIYLLKSNKIKSLPFIIDLWIWKDVFVKNIEYIYFPNLQIYKINVKIEDIIKDEFIIKTITIDINGNILETLF